MSARSRAELRSIPNLLSLSRLALAALFVPAGHRARIVLICLAGATDFLDGWLARRTNTTTRWGALVDPIADRLFVLVAIVTYLVNGQLSVVQMLLLLLRDVATALAFLIARAVPSLRGVEFKARLSGKFVTVFQLATLLALVIGVRPLTPFVAVVALTSILAIVDYARVAWRARVHAR